MTTFLLHHYYIINIILAFTLSVAMWRADSLLKQIFYFIVYLTFHYTYGLFPIFSSDFGSTFILQREDSHQAVNVVAVIFLAMSMLTITLKNKLSLSQIIKSIHSSKFSMLAVAIGFLWLLFSIASFYLNQADDKKLFLINVFMIICMVLGIGLSLPDRNKNYWKDISQISTYALWLLLVMVVAQTVELVTGRTWVCCDIVRSSGFLFNPNNLGFWLILVSAFFTYTYLIGQNVWSSYFAYTLILLSLLFSSSRSFFVNIIEFHFLILLFTYLYNRSKLLIRLKLIVYFYTLFSIIYVSLQLVWVTNAANSITLNRMQLNADRLMYTPAVIYQYFTGDSRLIAFLENSAKANTNKVSQDIIERKSELNRAGYENIKMRLSGESTDNGFAVLANSGSEITRALWLFILLLPFIGIFQRKFMRNAYAQIIMSYYAVILLSGFAINVFYVFPTWVILGLTYGLCSGVLSNYYANIYAKKIHLKDELVVRA